MVLSVVLVYIDMGNHPSIDSILLLKNFKFVVCSLTLLIKQNGNMSVSVSSFKSVLKLNRGLTHLGIVVLVTIGLNLLISKNFTPSAFLLSRIVQTPRNCGQ